MVAISKVPFLLRVRFYYLDLDLDLAAVSGGTSGPGLNHISVV